MGEDDVPEKVSKEDDAAIGRTVRFVFRTPERAILMIGPPVAGLVLGVMRMLSHGPAAQADMMAVLNKIHADVVEIKITENAILATEPRDQKAAAEKMIALQMAAIAMQKKDGE